MSFVCSNSNSNSNRIVIVVHGPKCSDFATMRAAREEIAAIDEDLAVFLGPGGWLQGAGVPPVRDRR
jgi:hypothetical protein